MQSTFYFLSLFVIFILILSLLYSVFQVVSFLNFFWIKCSLHLKHATYEIHPIVFGLIILPKNILYKLQYNSFNLEADILLIPRLQQFRIYSCRPLGYSALTVVFPDTFSYYYFSYVDS
jgi:hypothetical protein